jgi:hypothetical protein
VFNEWKAYRNVLASRPHSDISAIRVELLEMTKDELCFSLSRFVLEARKQSGDEYPAETLYDLVISLQLYLSSCGRELKLLDDHDFVTLKNTLDARMKELTAIGMWVPRRKAEVITAEDEDVLWSDVLGRNTPQRLLDTLIYLVGIHFALRAGAEHTNLRANGQISLQTDNDNQPFLRYREDTSKTKHGGLKHRRVEGKVVDAFQNTDNPGRCIVQIYRDYMSRRPTTSYCSPCLYLRPLAKPTSKVWYSSQPLGVQKITSTVSRLCAQAEVGEYKTNHSLRATAASRIYQSGLDEQLVCETTGHRSNCVRGYKRTTETQRRAVSQAWCPTAQSTGQATSTLQHEHEKRVVCIASTPSSIDKCPDSNENKPRTINVNIQIGT